MARTYRNFDITVVSEGAQFTVSARSSIGQAEVVAGLPFSADELDRFLGMFGGEQRRRLETDRYERTRDFGNRLYESFLNEEIRTLLAESMRAAEIDDMGLRIRMHLDGAPTLVNVPWEYLYRAQADDFVSLSNWTPVVRHLEVERRTPPARVTHPLRILVMIADPIERRGTLDVEREWSQLQQSLGEAESDRRAELTRLGTGRLDELQNALRETDYHVFHFIGHGAFSETHNDGALLMEDELGRTKIVAGRVLGDRLRDSRTMRLVVLNNCEGAVTSAFDPFAGAAQSLLKKGIPAVVAMQFAVTDLSALAFSRGFYRSIIDGYPVDASVAEGRKAIDEGANRFEFGAPVLYMSSDDGAIFAIDDASDVVELDPEARTVATDAPAAEAAPEDLAADTARPAEQETAPPPATPSPPLPKATRESRTRPLPTQHAPSEAMAGRPRRLILGAVAAAVVVLVGAIAVLSSGGDEPVTTTAASATTQGVAPATDAAGTTTDPPAPGALTAITDRSVATFTAAPLAIDGSDADWTSNFEMVSDNRIYDPNGEWDGPADLSGTWRLAWDEQYLYVFAVVIDEKVAHVTSGTGTFRGDAVAFNFDPNPDDNAPDADLTGNESGVFISPPIDPGANGEWTRLATSGRQPREFFNVADKTDSEGFLSAAIVVGPADNPTGYQLEARIPWLMLIGDRVPMVGDRFKMTLDVTDDDSGGNEQQTMFSNSPQRSLENRAKPGVWELMVLE